MDSAIQVIIYIGAIMGSLRIKKIIHAEFVVCENELINRCFVKCKIRIKLK